MDQPLVRLRQGRARPFWHGNPIIFSGAIAAVEGSPGTGDLVEVRDHDGRELGLGFYNPLSSYRVRLVRLAREENVPVDLPGLLAARLASARRLRRSLGLPGEQTTCYRLLNSEGDFLSGLTIDVYDELAVLQVSAAWVQVHAELVAAAAREVLGEHVRLVQRISPAVRRQEGLHGPEPVAAGLPVLVRENGLSFLVDPAQGQKTGFYLDQRENRLLVGALARGRKVLDLFCFTGGFALNCAAGGASTVRAVDSSPPAIAIARRNGERNELQAISWEAADALAVLDERAEAWDLIVLDPPRLARGHRGVDAAVNRYLRLNRAALAALPPGGILVSCSCSAAVRRDDFLAIIREAATEAGRRLAITHVRGAAPDHTLNPGYPEGEYLKCVVGIVQ